AEMDHVAVGVGQDLDLDVAGVGDVVLEVDPPVPEGRQRAEAGGPEPVGELSGVVDDDHALATPAGRRLEDDRIAHHRGGGAGLLGTGDGLRPGPERDAEAPGQVPGHDLVATLADHLRRRADEGDPFLGAGRGQLRPLRQEPVARVQRIAARDQRRRHHAADVEVAFGRRGGADADRVVGQVGRQAVAVCLGDGGHRLESLVDAGPDDADSDLAPVGDENALHGYPSGAPAGNTTGTLWNPHTCPLVHSGRSVRSSSNSGIRRSSSVMATAVSTRTRWTPRQRWIPWPRLRWRLGLRSGMRTSGWGKARRSRLARANHSRAVWPGSMVTSPTVTFSITSRPTRAGV